ncbi:hypothetical protein [Novosphingobium sp. 11B]
MASKPVQSPDLVSAPDRIRRFRHDAALAVQTREKPPIDCGQALLVRIPAEAGLDVLIGRQAKLTSRQFRSALAQAVREVVAGDHQIPALVIHPAHHDVGVRVRCTRLVLTTARRDLERPCEFRVESSLPIAAARPIRLPSKRVPERFALTP